MRFLPIKTDDQLDLLSLHRVREHWVMRRTAIANQIRGLLLERDITLRKGRCRTAPSASRPSKSSPPKEKARLTKKPPTKTVAKAQPEPVTSKVMGSREKRGLQPAQPPQGGNHAHSPKCCCKPARSV